MSNTTGNKRDRHDVLASIAALRPELQRHEADVRLHSQHASLLFQAGDFWQARDRLATLYQRNTLQSEDVALYGYLEYMLGHYGAALEAFHAEARQVGNDCPEQAMARIALLYYQTNRYQDAAALAFPSEAHNPFQAHVELMRAFGDEPPNEVIWRRPEKVATTHFQITDPLPVLRVELNGRPLHVLLDTGADSLIIDTELAKALGIETVAEFVGVYAGGKEAKTALARGDRLELEDVVVTSVPLTILPTRHFSRGFADGRYTIEGILGNRFLMQFLATIDYPRNRLVLRENTPGGKAQTTHAPASPSVAKVPFALSKTHEMMATGSLNDRTGLTFFVDSGLASNTVEAFSAPLQTLRYAGIEPPQTRMHDEDIGGGGGRIATGSFDIDSLGLGPLLHSRVKGTFGDTSSDSYWAHGFIQDGLISHHFLRRYAWTLDFSERCFHFTR